MDIHVLLTAWGHLRHRERERKQDEDENRTDTRTDGTQTQ